MKGGIHAEQGTGNKNTMYKDEHKTRLAYRIAWKEWRCTNQEKEAQIVSINYKFNGTTTGSVNPLNNCLAVYWYSLTTVKTMRNKYYEGHTYETEKSNKDVAKAHYIK